MEGAIVRVIDADGHVEENEVTFSDKYFDPAFRSQRPQVVAGNEEGLVDSGAANNSALSGAYVPAMVFGIPGDSITAIVIGVLYVKGLNPGPMVFINNAVEVNAIFMVFLPLSLTANFIASRTIADWPLVPRVVLVTTVMTPLMTYVFLPWVTRRMSWWLHR